MIMFEDNNDMIIIAATKNGSSTMNYNTLRIEKCIYNIISLNIMNKKIFKYLQK